MAVIQKRIYELLDYTQLSPGDTGYIDPSTVYLAVDRSGWSESRRMDLTQFIFSSHIEAGFATVGGVNISVTYDLAFSGATYPIQVNAYKEITQNINGTPVTVRQNIPFHSFVPTATGFTLVLEEYVGVSVQYTAFEI